MTWLRQWRQHRAKLRLLRALDAVERSHGLPVGSLDDVYDTSMMRARRQIPPGAYVRARP